ncbi:predicted protein [Nematostella vectensis]|uniref:Oxidized purine nucleoside triphosphate hydrolase n=1 Tax=Nematostella vectensis TaxID=45351 RepID=A7SEA9_NEMVE|nr:oxidized purine nucleoside triphosphate hydrolase [Nematostella vectensis]EDO37977.1 predicted protein [Nematostella vectensis]|eukprot:XP_001630040.1 predicted protein [Nematostella vectensis]
MSKNKLLTLVLVHDSVRVLLGMKKRGFGVGRWNGFGGKVECGETIEQAARRELLEESGLTATRLEEAGILMFEFKGDPVILEVHVFRSEEFTGEPTETEEMRPHWFENSAIPFDEMWPDDILWFPHFLKKEKFEGYFLFEGLSKILDYKLDVL